MARRGKNFIGFIALLLLVSLFAGCTLPNNLTAPPDPAASAAGSESTEAPSSILPDQPNATPTAPAGGTPGQTEAPDVQVSVQPTVVPTVIPTVNPTGTPRPIETPKPIVVPTSNLTPTKAPTVAPTTPAPTKTPAPTASGSGTVTKAQVYCRSVLNQSQQAAYDTIYAGLSDPSKIETATVDYETVHLIKVSVSYRASSNLEKEIKLILSAILMDHPELYYLDKQYTYSYSGTRLTEFRMYTLDRSTALSLRSQVENGIQAYQQKVSPHQDPYEIAKQFYELLATNIQYGQDGTSHAYSIVGAFVNGQCVCEGFSEAYQLLLNAYGIRAFTVSGTAGGAHQWNAVEINGKWYYTDPTWGNLKTLGEKDTYPKEGYIRVSYVYLNLNAALMGADHTLDETSASMTAGLSFTATQDNYFVREGGYFASFQQNAVETYVKAAIADAIANKRETVGIRMGSQQAYDSLVDYIYRNLYRVYYEAGGQDAALSYYPGDVTYTVHISMH
ncbi:MAG: hypothetical protein J6L76_06625 [Clostridia bacterium]|nr:hypothetical protein [Clostridia bacterium]